MKHTERIHDAVTATNALAPDPTAVRPWRLGALAGMASFIDAGMIVAVSYVIAIWERIYSLTPLEVGAIAASLTISIGVGSVIGGRLGDLVGRKRIYTYDLIVVAIGLVIVLLAQGPEMLFVGIIVTGLAMGADIPTSLALVGEMSPADKRGQILSFGWLLWVGGILFVVILVAGFGGVVGDNLPYLLFGGLLVATAVTWVLRARIKESQAWLNATASIKTPDPTGARPASLWTRPVILGLLFTASFYLFLTLGTNFLGAFNVYLLATVGGLQEQVIALLSLITLALTTTCILVVMRLLDTRARRPMFYIGSALMVGAWVLALSGGDAVIALIAALIVYNVGSMFAGEMHWRVWAQELSPTLLRGATQGISFGIARAASGVFLLFAPAIIAADYRIVLWIMLGLCIASGLIGTFGMPRKQNRSIDEIEREFGTR